MHSPVQRGPSHDLFRNVFCALLPDDLLEFIDYTLKGTGNVLTSGPAGSAADASESLDLLAREGDAMAPGALTGTFMDCRLSDTGKGFFLS